MRVGYLRFGVLMHEVLAGRRPLDGPAGQVANLALPPDTPTALVEIVKRCLAPVPSERFSRTNAVLTTLKAYQRSRRVPPSRSRQRHLAQAALVVGVGILAAGLASFFATR